MTASSRATRTIAGLLVALVLTAFAAGCASKADPDNNATGDTGAGQLGEAAAAAGGQGVNDPAPTPIPTPPVDEVPATPAPTLSPGIILTIAPGLLTPWPSSPDCIGYDPTIASIKYTASIPLWQVMSGNSALLAFKQSGDATAGLALVKAYKKICFIGRNNTRADRARYILTYWMDPVSSAAPAITNPDCLPHVASELVVQDAGSLGFRVAAGSESLALFDTKTDADNAVLVMKHYNRHCYIGRSYNGTDRLNYITDWFATV
jgi:hypothetical protein